jgi:hypothetical protein
VPPARAATPLTDAGWKDAGICAAEIPNGRLLADARMDSDTMTPDLCVAFCAGKGFDLAGIE